MFRKEVKYIKLKVHFKQLYITVLYTLCGMCVHIHVYTQSYKTLVSWNWLGGTVIIIWGDVSMWQESDLELNKLIWYVDSMF
jgi:hypothetical protein